MKKLLLLFLIVIIIIPSCGKRITYIDKQFSVYGIDFREYSKKGFLFTPYSYKGEYNSIGLVTFSAISGADYVLLEVERGNNREFERYGWVLENPTSEEIVNYAYAEAVKMGADALCDFKITTSYKTIFTGIENVNLKVMDVYGFAIKRK
jgi:hypothetical protein